MHKRYLISSKIVLFFVIGLMVVGVALAARNQPTGTFIKISLMSQEPDPVEPGNYVDIRFKVENLGGEGTDTLTLELLPVFPFTLQPGESKTRELGSFRANQKGEEGVIVKYRMIVNKYSVIGDNELALRYKIGNDPWVTLEPFIIEVKPFDAVLTISDVRVLPELIGPGSSSTVSLVLHNDADVALKKIRLLLDLDDVPLAPQGSTNEKVVAQLLRNQTTTVNFSLVAEPDAASKLYKVPLQIVFKDELGRNFSLNNIIGLTIGEEPNLAVIMENSEIYKAGQTGIITIKIVNKGVSDIKLVNLYVKESEAFIIVSPKETYIGDIDSDDYETTDITLYLKKGKDQVNVPLTLEYLSANNQRHQKDLMLPLKLYSDSEAKKIGLAKNSSALGIIITLAIIGAGIYFYLRWRKKKKKHA